MDVTDATYAKKTDLESAVVTATIANGATVSDTLFLSDCRLVAFIFPTMTGGTVTFQSCDTLDGTFRAVYDDAGNQISVTATDTAVVSCTGTVAAALAPLKFLKIVSASAEGDDREIKVLLRG